MEERIDHLYSAIQFAYGNYLSPFTFTVAISGIDASWKGFVSEKLKLLLEDAGLKVALKRLDDWQMPKSISLVKQQAAENFYYNSFRWDALFSQVILPLQEKHRLQLQFATVQMEADDIVLSHYDLHDINIILVEGIFLFRKEFLENWHYKIWVECSFEKAMQRALERNQERLSTAQLISDYQTYYFPAQQFHIEKDQPKENANIIFDNN